MWAFKIWRTDSLLVRLASSLLSTDSGKKSTIAPTFLASSSPPLYTRCFSGSRISLCFHLPRRGRRKEGRKEGIELYGRQRVILLLISCETPPVKGILICTYFAGGRFAVVLIKRISPLDLGVACTYTYITRAKVQVQENAFNPKFLNGAFL